MKKQVLALAGVLSLLLVAGTALAQSPITADVPFNFTVNKTSMPAGKYSISNVGTDSSTLLIQSKDRQYSKLFLPNRAEAPTVAQRTKLVFHCYGKDQCFLYQIWVQGAKRGRELPPSSFEREIAANQDSRNVPVLASVH